MAVELDNAFTTDRSTDENWTAIQDLERLIPAVEGGTVTEAVSPDGVKAQIVVKMGAMSMKFKGTVDVAERDDAAKKLVLKVKSRDATGSGYANADVTFQLDEAGGGTVHTVAQITGKAASMGEGMVATVLTALIDDFTSRIATI